MGWLGVACVGPVLVAEELLWHVLGEATMLELTFGTAALAVAFGRGWGAARIAAWTWWLRSCGRLSYEIYPSHMFVVWPAVWMFRWSGGDLRLGWLWFPPIVALAWALGWVGRPDDLNAFRPLAAGAPEPAGGIEPRGWPAHSRRGKFA